MKSQTWKSDPISYPPPPNNKKCFWIIRCKKCTLTFVVTPRPMSKQTKQIKVYWILSSFKLHTGSNKKTINHKYERDPKVYIQQYGVNYTTCKKYIKVQFSGAPALKEMFSMPILFKNLRFEIQISQLDLCSSRINYNLSLWCMNLTLILWFNNQHWITGAIYSQEIPQ